MTRSATAPAAAPLNWKDLADVLTDASDEIQQAAHVSRHLDAPELGACFAAMAACLDRIVREIEDGQRYL